MATATEPGFLRLPAELRLQIANYFFAQPPTAGFTMIHTVPDPNPSDPTAADDADPPDKLVLDATYSASASLNLLIVCRRFHLEFAILAVQSTPLIMRSAYTTWMDHPPPFFVENLTKLIIQATQRHLKDFSKSWPCHILQRLRLKELSFALVLGNASSLVFEVRDITYLMRRLRNIDSLRFYQNTMTTADYRRFCNGLVWDILNTDRAQRYGRSQANEPPATWWEWKYCGDGCFLEFVPVPAIPAMELEAYQKIMVPLEAQYYGRSRRTARRELAIEELDTLGMTWKKEPEKYAEPRSMEIEVRLNTVDAIVEHFFLGGASPVRRGAASF